jgi:tRNA (guanine6-N2)-methyltransferase
MNSYYSTFIPGLLEPVREALADTLPQCRISLCLDGLIAYETAVPPNMMRVLPFVTNTFFVFKSYPRNPARTLNEMAIQIADDRRLIINNLPKQKGSKTFRVIVSLANHLVSIDNAVMQRVEKRIAPQSKLRPNRSKPDYEFWLLQRSEGYGFFSVRLSQHKAYDQILQKGELRPELANILCRLSEPSSGELFLDPFCGSGAIPIQRARFPTGLVIASDSRKDKVEFLKQRVKELGLKRKIVVRSDNALQLERYSAGSIHKIVTDPPWGLFEDLEMPLSEFYDKMMAEFCRILAPRGLLVVLTAQTELLASSVTKMGRKLTILRTYNILVSGKKACVCVIRRSENI